MRPFWGGLMAASLSDELLVRWSSRYREILLNFFRRRIPHNADREDLVQEVFLHMARRSNLGDVRDVERFLFHAAGNVLKDWRRKQLTHAADRHEPISDELQDVGSTPERVLLGTEALESLLSALEDLPQRTRSIFILYHFELMSHAQIARELGIAIRTVEDHVARANRRLLAVMKDLL